MALSYARAAIAIALGLLLAAPPALAQAVPDITVTPDAVDFGTLSVPGGTDVFFTVRNDGVGDLVVSNVFTTDLTGDDSFGDPYDPVDTFLTFPITLAPGETKELGVTVSPRVGQQDGTVTFESNDPDEGTVVVPITYFGTEIRFGPVMPATIDFGTVSVAVDSFGDVVETATVCREVRVATEGDEDGFASGFFVSDDQFSVPADDDPDDIDDGSFVPVSAGDTLAFDVCYTPDEVGPATGTLEFDLRSSVNGFDVLSRQVSLTGEATTTNLPPVPQGIADGQTIDIPYDPATQLIAGTIDFSFLSPESGQTTEITSPDFEFGDLIDAADETDATVTFASTPGNPAVGRIEVALGPGTSVTGGDQFDVTLVACDDGPGGGECTEITVTVRLEFFPTRGCVVADSWDVLEFDPDASSGTEFITVYAGGPGPLDLSDCTFVAFDPFTERVTLAVDLEDTDSLFPFEDARPFLTFGPDEIPDGPGAIAFVQGGAAVGDPVSSVLGRVVYALVYLDGSTPVGVFPADEPLGARVRSTAAGASDLADLLADLRASAGDVGPALAVGPNPVRGSAAVTFRLDADGPARVAVYDVLGREVAVLARGTFQAGAHRAPLDAATLPAGTYVVRLAAGGVVEAARLTVVR